MTRLILILIASACLASPAWAESDKSDYGSSFYSGTEKAAKKAKKEKKEKKKAKSVASVTEAGHTAEKPAAPSAQAPAEPAAAASTQAHADSHAERHPASQAPSHHEVKGLAPEEALRLLKDGNRRFAAASYRESGRSAEERSRLAKGQSPHTIILSCSDSRVPPELIFDQGLGDLFVVRSAGETVDATGIASIEYAVAHLGTRLIVVMGHESCGAVKAAYETLQSKDAGSPALNTLVGKIHPHLAPFAGKSPTTGLISETSEHVVHVAKELGEQSAILREKIRNGELVVKSAIYLLNSGSVMFVE